MSDMQLILVVVIVGLLMALLIAGPITHRTRNMKLKKSMDRVLNPVAWSEVINECRDIGLTFTLPVEGVVFNKEGTRRAIILKRNVGFQLHYERLEAYDEDEMPYVHEGEARGYWVDGFQTKTIVDTMETAQRIIEDEGWLR
jgi:hypothetical protein